MARQWFYSHKGQNFGPVSARQLKYLAATGGLQPEDLIWPDGADPGRATVAGGALDFANLRRLAQKVRRRPAPGKAAAPALTRAVEEADPRLQRAAADALKKMEPATAEKAGSR